jgi:hypothetical protein
MKQLLFIPLLVLSISSCSTQSHRSEPVEWLNPKTYKAKTFSFKTDSINFDATNCKILEIRSTSGVTGYYLEGDANIHIETKNLQEKCTAAMFRFNPLDVDSLFTIENLKEIRDDSFVSSSLTVLKSTFRHCYHKNMDALIPDTGNCAVNFFSPRIGEVLVSQAKEGIIYYNFSLRTKM